MIQGTKVQTEINWQRSAVIEAKIISMCQGCNRIAVRGLEIDTSGEEYGSALICFNCIEDLDINLAQMQFDKKTT